MGPEKIRRKMLFLRFSDGTRLVPSKNRQINICWTNFLTFSYNLYSHHLVTVMQALTATSRVMYKNPVYFIPVPKKICRKSMFSRFSDGTILVPSKNRQILYRSRNKNPSNKLCFDVFRMGPLWYHPKIFKLMFFARIS